MTIAAIVLLWFMGGLGWIFQQEEEKQQNLTLYGRTLLMIIWPLVTAVSLVATAYTWWTSEELSAGGPTSGKNE